MEHLSLDALRTFLSIVDLDGFNKAAEKVHLSQSAISMQMKKLEEQTGHSLFERKGRQRQLTHHGEVLLGYARRMLQLNDELLENLKESKQKGKIRIGIQGDFAGSPLAGAIYRYVRHHPELMLELKVEPSDTLQDMLTRQKLDLIVYLAREKNKAFDAVAMGVHPLEWVRSPTFSLQLPVPLVVLSPNCKIRQTVSATLTDADIPWRIAFASSSLPVAWGAIAAGIGVGARTRIGMPRSLMVMPASAGLPPLPAVRAWLCTSSKECSGIILRLKEFLFNETNKTGWTWHSAT